ncbi:catechol 2,3-dioxygenase-like lactoylglutathione lyase family enzyme [Kitasatospora sp. GAS204A]|uniref:VOC family protein n=1 Tax=unclassified Kitasatospora TaxID=2633591 RepID=UPI0024768728|nr:VOC family protein [Kitasatospora sp. GAS204B]MDH6116718.1 catechol 2,3-dioxygenase-like lactoylglutathione lyase family enzyme [Kitasatospora sp. GAS204B]
MSTELTQQQVADRITTMSSCLVVADIDRAIDWYQRILGFALVNRLDMPERGERVAFLGSGTLRLELAERTGSASLRRADPPEHGSVQGPSHLSFYVDDLEAVLERLAALGVPPVVGPVDVTPLAIRVAFVRDVEDHLIEFVQTAPW